LQSFTESEEALQIKWNETYLDVNSIYNYNWFLFHHLEFLLAIR